MGPAQEEAVSSGICPTCDDEFKSERGVKLHHARTHGERLTLTTVECDWCGEKHEKKAKDTDGANLCSDECLSNWMSATGGQEKTRVEVECDFCGDVYGVVPSAVDKTRFCSRECKDEDLVGVSGADHPKYSQVKVECETCGEPKTVTPSQLESYDNHFCDNDCLGEWLKKHQSGSDSPRWGGGYGYAGENWHRQRTRAIQRDGEECVRCGISRENHRSETGFDLSVHHREKRTNFLQDDGSIDYERANRLENLVTLCRECHQIVEHN